MIEKGTVGTVATIIINNPPVNLGGSRQRRELLQALRSVRNRPDVTAVVISTAGSHFYAGSDLKEFDGDLQEPQLPEIIEEIESLPVPVVAAIKGLALGGGFELALGCDARIADGSAEMGFPEVGLGILPGAGGTVRCTRLAGVAAALDLVISGRRVNSGEAVELGLVNRVSRSEDVLAEAVQYAYSLAGKRLARDAACPPDTREALDEALGRARRRARPNALRAIEIIQESARLSAGEALLLEREAFEALRRSPEAANLRYLFFAKRAAAKALRSDAKARPVRSIGVAGAGTMGSLIAKQCRQAGYAVTLFDKDEVALERAAAASGAAITQNLAGLGSSDLVIDAVFEDMDVKKALFRDLERVADPQTVLASNTSYLDPDVMAGALSHPHRFGGLHFFNPADRNPLVEIIRAQETDDRTAATLAAVAASLGKAVIPAGVGDGFVANRVYNAYRTQSEYLLEDGAAPESVDAAMMQLGLPIGPFAVADMSGLDIAWARRKRLADGRDPLQRYVELPDQLCELGRFGRKTGAGWYSYAVSKRGEPDPVVEKLIEAARRRRGTPARSISVAEIQLRNLCAMLCAAAELVRDGIAQRASDVDVAMTEGFAFPRWLGGPLRHLAGMDPQTVIEGMAAVYQSCPLTFAIAGEAVRGTLPADIERVLQEVTTGHPGKPSGPAESRHGASAASAAFSLTAYNL